MTIEIIDASRLLHVDQSQWASFFDELKDESDRGAAVLTAAWIDHLLESKLALLFSGENAKARAQLVNFSRRINAAFRVGLLNDDVYHDLNVIRKIRNEFAHQIAVVPVVRTVFRVLKWKPCSARRRGGGNVKIGFIDFQGLVGRAENSSIVFRAFHETGISTAWVVAR